MMELDELKVALNWHGVYTGRDCLVIQFDESERNSIQGLRNSSGPNGTFYLQFPEYQDALISFQITRGDDMFQYWVMGDKLHHPTGPAYITTNSTLGNSHVKYYHNGVKHRTNGPADIVIRGQRLSPVHPTSLVPVPDDYLIEEWNWLEASWWTDGTPALYPLPHSILCKDGHRIYRQTGTAPMMTNMGEHPAFFAASLAGNWNRETSLLDTDPSRIRFISVLDYYRNYVNGEPKKHGCASIDKLSWIMQGNITDIIDREKLRHIKDDLFEYWNIWDGPLFPSLQEQSLVMGELSR